MAAAEQMGSFGSASKWRAKRNAQGQIIPHCWQTSNGYTVAAVRTPKVVYTVTRPGEAAPLPRTPDRQQVSVLIHADERALA